MNLHESSFTLNPRLVLNRRLFFAEENIKLIVKMAGVLWLLSGWMHANALLPEIPTLTHIYHVRVKAQSLLTLQSALRKRLGKIRFANIFFFCF